MKVFTALVLLLEVLGLDIGFSRIGLTLLMTLPNSRKVESEGEANHSRHFWRRGRPAHASGPPLCVLSSR